MSRKQTNWGLPFGFLLLIAILAGIFGCASAPRTESAVLQEIFVQNETIETVRVYVDGRRVATVLPKETGCVPVRQYNAKVTYSFVGSRNHRKSAMLPPDIRDLTWLITGTDNDEHAIKPGGGCATGRV